MCAVAALIPSVREYFQRRLQIRERVLLAQFNTLSEVNLPSMESVCNIPVVDSDPSKNVQDYKNHVVEIQSKLLSMIEDVILKQLYKVREYTVLEFCLAMEYYMQWLELLRLKFHIYFSGMAKQLLLRQASETL